MSASGRAPYLFFLREGVSYSLNDVMPACEVFSRAFVGEIWTYGSYEADQQVGGIRLRVVKFDEYQRRKSYLQYARIVTNRARELKQKNTENVVVISYDPFKNGLLAKRVKRLTGGVFIAEVNGVYGHTDNFADEPRMWMRRLRILAMRLVGSHVLRHADGIRLLYDTQLDDFAKAPRSAVVRRFFDLTLTDRFSPGEEQPVILLAGHPFRRKGVDLLFEAFTRVSARHPEWRLVMIGHGLPASMEAHGLKHPNVRVLAGMPQPELVSWVARCAVLALPSRSEAMGRILIEAAAAGKPRLATRVVGMPTIVEHEVDGLLFEKENVADLAAALDRLMSDDAFRRQLGVNARRRALDELTPDAYVKHYVSMVDAVLAARGSARA